MENFFAILSEGILPTYYRTLTVISLRPIDFVSTKIYKIFSSLPTKHMVTTGGGGGN
ncbi:MAG: hypothetical protein LBF49_03435 [Puniceicoccales bacterium]|nr:hypothetical protein [Puniceicoccales bacterium]